MFTEGDIGNMDFKIVDVGNVDVVDKWGIGNS